MSIIFRHLPNYFITGQTSRAVATIKRQLRIQVEHRLAGWRTGRPEWSEHRLHPIHIVEFSLGLRNSRSACVNPTRPIEAGSV